MRKNRTKHEAKKPRLAKRALALCFALIFVCSCLLPAFANSEGTLPTDPLTMVEQKDEQQPEELSLLNESGEESGENPTEGDEEQDEQKQEEANASKETPEEPASSSAASSEASSESQSTAPSESASSEGSASTAPGESASSSSASSSASSEQPASSKQPANSEQSASSEQPASSETKPEEPKQPTTNTTGDTIEQGEATYTYRFWPDKIDAFDLEAINDDVKAGTSLNDAAQLRAGMVPCTVLTVMTNATLRDYQANVQQPTKSGYEFAGWYTVDGTTEDKFSFEQSLNFEESQTIDVFAKWNELVTLRATATVDVDATLFGGEAAISLADEYSYDDDRMAAPTKTLTLDVEATNLSSNSELSVSSTSSNDIDTYCENNDLMPILTLDITPKDKDSGKKTEPQETSTVTISGLSELELPDELTMVHKKDNGEIEKIPAQYSNGTLTFEATSFSTYAVAAAASKRGGGSTNTGSWVYLYAAFEDNKIQGYTPSGSRWANKYWVTIGKLWVENIADISRNHSFDGTHVTDGPNYSNVIKALNNYKDGSDSTKFERFEANKGINIDYIVWNRQETFQEKNVFGLSQGGGASPYVTNANTPTWHLDGYAQRVGAYKINYLEKDTNRVLKPSVESVGTAGTVINADNFKEKPITVGGKTYNYVDCDKKSVTIIEGNTVEINLYYEREVNLLGIPDSDDSFIVVEKRFSGLTKETIPANFKITVGSSEYGLNSGNIVYNNQVGNDYVVRWKITGVDAGEYRITESGYGKPGYKTEATVTGSATAFDPVAGTTVKVEVPTLSDFEAKVIPEKNKFSYPVTMTSTTNTIFVGNLNGNNGLVVFTAEPLNYAQRKAVEEALGSYDEMRQGGIWGGAGVNIHFYSVKEQLESGKSFAIDGSTVTYNNGQITFGDKGIWHLVATATYTTTKAQNPEVSITNTYTLNTTNVTITKKTTGAFADRAKAFKFTVSGLNTDATLDGVAATGGRVAFELANGNSRTIENLKVGQTITITEDRNDSKDYDTTADGHAKVNAGREKSFQYKVCFDATRGEIYLQALDANGNAITGKTITGENLSITVTNDFDGNPDTGVLLDTLPYLILLAVAVAGGVLVVVRKRKHRDE